MRPFFHAFLLFLSLPASLLAQVRFNGYHYVPLAEVARQSGLAVQLEGDKASLRRGSLRVDFPLHKRYFFLGGRKVALGLPVGKSVSGLCVAKADIQETLRPLLRPYHVQTPPPSLFTIVIDAGHGGKDSGAHQNGLSEKDFTLKLALALADVLKKKGFRVYLTRSKDKFVSLSERSRFSNRHGADLFISLHFNSASTTAEGIETYTLTPKRLPSSSSKTLHKSLIKQVNRTGDSYQPYGAIVGFLIQDGLIRHTQAVDRGLKYARFAVLTRTQAPAVLIEGGFLTHSEEAKRIQSSVYQEQLLNGILDGLSRYARVLKKARTQRGLTGNR